MSAAIIDITEFFKSPIRSGIQRVVREIILNWPESIPVTYAAYDPTRDCLMAISSAVVEYTLEISAYDNLSDEDIGRWVQEAWRAEPLEPVAVEGAHILVPEVFYPKQRILYYRRMLEQGTAVPHFIVYDLIPWLRPAVVKVNDAPGGMMHYLELVKQADRRAFISKAVRDEFAARILRTEPDDPEAGVALPLGADGLRLDRQTYRPDRRSFVCIGAFDGRKSQHLLLEAFLRLPPTERGELVFIGRVPTNLSPELQRIIDYQGLDVRVLQNPADTVIREVMEGALATAFISTAEGFGLPAVESLAAGIPIIVHSELPAVSDLSPDGQIRLDSIDVETLAGALKSFLEPETAQRLWRGAAAQHPQTWAEYGRRVAEWVSQPSPVRPRARAQV